MEIGLITCLWMLGGLAVISLLLQLLIIYCFVWGKTYNMKARSGDREISISGDVDELHKEVKELREIIKQLQKAKN